MDEKSHAGNNEAHDGSERIKLKCQVDFKCTWFDPTEKTDPVKYVDFINDFFKVSNERSKKWNTYTD